MKIRSVLVCFLCLYTSSFPLDKKDVETERNRIRMLALMTCLESSNSKYSDLFKNDGSLASVLELGRYNDEIVYSKIDSAAKKAGLKVFSGKYGGNLEMLKCWNFVASPGFDSLVKTLDRYLPIRNL